MPIRVCLHALHPDQQTIRSEAKRFNVVNCGRRWGKTTKGENDLIEPALEGFPTAWFAPEYKLITEVWEEVLEMTRPAWAKVRPVNSQQKRIKLRTGGRIDFWSFDRSPRAGRSRKYKRIIFDEAGHCDNLETVWTRAVRPTLTDFIGDAWFYSSPNGGNYFKTLYEFGQDGRPGWMSWTRTSYDNPFLDPAEIDDAKLDLADPIFRQEYLAEFLAETRQQLLLGTWLDLCWTETKPEPKGPRFLSVDVSKGTGRDRTVIMVCDSAGLLDLLVSNVVSIPAAAKLVRDVARQWGVAHDHIVFDAGGWAGSEMGHELEALGILSANGYRGGHPGSTRFKNRRTRAAWRLRQRLDPERSATEVESIPPQGYSLAMRRRFEATRSVTASRPPAFAIPASVVGDHWEGLKRELTELLYQFDGFKIGLEKKAVMQKRLGFSPDLADTLIMNAALWSD